MAAKMQTKEALEEYSKRKETVESPFDHMKYNLKLTEFLNRGKNGGETKGNLLSFSHNSKRIWNIVKHNISKLFHSITLNTDKNQQKSATC